MAELTDIRETVRERYAAAARTTSSGCCGTSTGDSCGCGPSTTDMAGTEVFGDALYAGGAAEGATAGAVGTPQPSEAATAPTC